MLTGWPASFLAVRIWWVNAGQFASKRSKSVEGILAFRPTMVASSVARSRLTLQSLRPDGTGWLSACSLATSPSRTSRTRLSAAAPTMTAVALKHAALNVFRASAMYEAVTGPMAARFLR